MPFSPLPEDRWSNSSLEVLGLLYLIWPEQTLMKATSRCWSNNKAVRYAKSAARVLSFNVSGSPGGAGKPC